MSTAASPVTQTRTKFVPPFLAKLGIAPGEWSYTSKLTVRLMARPGWPLKVRIWACLMIQSFGYEGDLAVIMRKADRPGGLPKVEPLKPHNIIQMLNRATVEAYKESKLPLSEEQLAAATVSRQHMRRALAEMETQDGAIVRVRANVPVHSLHGLSIDEAINRNAVTPLAGLSAKDAARVQQKVCVYLLARPKPAKSFESEYVAKNHLHNSDKSNGISSPLAQLILPFLSRGDRSMAPAVLQRPEVAAWLDAGRQLIEKAVQEVKASSITGRKPGETGSVPNPILRAEPPNTRHSAPPVHEAASSETAHSNPRPVTPNGQAASPVSAVANPKRSGRLDEQSPADEDQRTQRPVAPAIAESISQADVSLVLPAMRKYCVNGVSRNMARKLIRACRAHDRHATCATIIAAIDAKGPSILAHPKIYNPPAVLAKCVPELFEGGLSAAPIRKRDESTWGPLSEAELAEMERK